MSTLAGLDAIVEMLGRVSSASAETAKQVEANAQRVIKALDRQNDGLTKGLRQLREMADSGNEWAQRADQIAGAVAEGLAPASVAIHGFGDAMIEIEGRSRSWRDFASGLGLGQLNTDLRTLIETSKTYEERVGILNDLQGEQAQSVAKLIEAYSNGSATIDEVLQKLGEAQRAQGVLGQLATDLYADLKNKQRQGHT